jgi:hypothetical protein
VTAGVTLLHEFLRDFVDRSAARAPTANWGVESLTTLGVGVLAASAQAEAVGKLAGTVVGDFSTAVQMLLLLGAILWCAAIVSAKTAAAPGYVYTYSQWLRTLAKAGLLGAIAFLPFRLAALADEWTPLPDTVYGFVYDSAGRPVDNARLRLLSLAGQDITSGSWFTDSRGFYAVRAIRRLRRSDAIRIAPEGCKTAQTLPLARIYAAPAAAPWPPELANASPRFLHHLECEAK